MNIRLWLSLITIILPIVLFIKGIYGSFIFTFSIALFWEIGVCAKPLSSLELKRKFFKSAVITGLVTGVVFALVAGNILKIFGITEYVGTNFARLQYSFGFFKTGFWLKNELGYRLLSMSNTLKGTFLYLFFCLFAIGLGEELFWRGFIQRKISNYFAKTTSIWLAAFLFSLAHSYIFIFLPLKMGISFLVIIATGGAFWGYLFEHFNNIWGPAVSHGIVAFVVWKYYFFAFLAQ